MSTNRHRSKSQVTVRYVSAIAIVAAGLGLTGLASSQGTAAPKPKASASGKPTAADVNAPPPPNFSPKPPGVNQVLNEKGPGLPVLIATSPWPATLLGAAPVAAATSPTAVNTAAPNAPSGDQATALAQLEAAAKDYRIGASAYSKAVGQIIRQRYEQKRKARLSQLQENIDKDMAELKKARLDTMERLKAFLAKYPDVPEHTPNAMFRLAALYEEQAVDSDVDPADPDYTNKLRAAYEPAERLYRDIIARFPKYSQRASVHFFLGALLSDTGRGPESVYVWRALVCSNHFEFPVPPPQNPAEAKLQEKWKDGIPPGPQDHDMAFWDKWRETHYTIPDPKAKKKPAPPKKPGAVATPVTASEDEYNNPYPDDCIPIGGATTATGEEQAFVSQAWWRIGEYHYSRGDDSAEEEGYFGASPYRLNRALTSYEHAIKTSNETVKVFSMYKIAWTLYKQQRYSAARQKFMELLNYFDEKEKSGGQSGDAQMRQDAYDYSAASLTYLDMEGPGANEPFIERDDIFGLYSGKELEAKLRVAIDRVQDPKIIPQDKPWTPRIYKALAAEFESDEVQLDAIETYELILKKWDCDPEAPTFQKTIADLYDLLAIKAESPADKEMYSGKALEARTKLLNYVGNTKWTECNKNNPDAIRTAESLMNEGVKNAAGRHTSLGRVWMSQASSDPEGSPKQKNDLQHARDEYLLADRGWSAYLNQDPDAADAYDSKFFIADARHKVVLATQLMGEKLDPKKVDEARAAAVEVRDSNLDDKYLRYAAYFAVNVVDMLAQEGFDAYKKSGCQIGVGTEVVDSPLDEPQDSCRPEGEKESRDEKTQKRIWVRTVPDVVVRTFRERDEFAAKVPPSLDTDHNIPRFEFEVADGLYRYGRFDEARTRFEKIWKDHCKVDDNGFEAWYRLGVMSNLMGDSKRSLELVTAAKSNSCAMNEEQRQREKEFSDPTELQALYLQADEAFNAAEKETNPTIKAQKYREAAAKYELALKRAPSRPEAPRGAMNSAYCYKQVNDYKRAAEVYRFFLDKYGKEEDLIAYRDGDAKKGIKKDPEQFKTRLDYTKRALDELGRTYLQAFDYPNAAKHYDEVAGRTLLDEAQRRDASANAVILQGNLGNRDKMLAAHTRFLGFHPSAADKAELDFVVAEFEFKQWKVTPTDNAQKARAATALDKYYTTYKTQAPGAKFVVDAAYEMATLRKAGGEASFRDWYKKTSDAFLTYKGANKDAIGSRESDYGAEASYFFVNETIEKEWDAVGATPRIKYEGDANAVVKKLEADDKKRLKYISDLEDINKIYVSPKWFPVVLGREGTVDDVQRTALAKSKVEVLDKATDAKIKSIEAKAQKTLENPNASPEDQEAAQKLLEQADAIRQNTNKAWTDKRTAYYNVLQPEMIDRYAQSYLRGKQFDVKDPMVTRSVQRLAFYTDQLGDVKMREYLIGVEKAMPPFKYRDQMFKQARPGAVTAPPPNVEVPNGPGVSAGANPKPE